MHNKSRQQHNQDGDPEAPQLDELIPDKLARPDDPLEKAIDFLKPLQILAKDYIQTHLMAFEIYYRKNKLLLMLQSLKRARKLDSTHPVLHACIIKFRKALDSTDNIDPNVKLVIDKEVDVLFGGRNASELCDLVLEKYGKSSAHVLEVAKILYKNDPKGSKVKAINLATSMDFADLSLQVRYH